MKNIYFIFCSLFISYSVLFAQGNCITEAGVLPTDTAFICVQSSIEVEAEGAILEEKDALAYLLHTTPDIFEGTIIDTSLAGIVEWNLHENEIIELHQLYYLSVVVGLDEDENGLPDDLASECTVVSESMPIVWVAEVDFLTNVDCDYSQAYFDHELCSYQGGLAYVISNIEQEDLAVNSLERTFSIKVNDREFETTQNIGFVANHDEILNRYIDIEISDKWHCLDTTLVVEIGWCHPSSRFDYLGISNMPTELQIICGNEETTVDAGCIYGLSPFGGEHEHYVISLSSKYNADSIIAVNDTTIGIFSYEDIEAKFLNRELYVFARQEAYNGLTGQWNLFYSHEPTPVIFLQPFEIQITVDNCEAATANVQLSVIGGYPSYEGNELSNYQLNSDLFEGELELKLGEIANIEVSEPTIQVEEMITFEITDSYGCSQFIDAPNPCLIDVGIYTFENPSFSLENIYPVPTKDFLHLNIQATKKETVQLQLLDITGKKIIEQFHELQWGTNKLQLEVNELFAGVYFLQLVGTEGQVVQKIIVE